MTSVNLILRKKYTDKDDKYPITFIIRNKGTTFFQGKPEKKPLRGKYCLF
jgi:hypothetical protein